MAPALLPITVQAVALSVVSSLLAQVLTAYQTQRPLAIDPLPVVKFVIFTILTTPPNVLWQGFLERSFPGSRPAANPANGSANGKSKEASSPPAKEQQLGALHIPNTITKTLLDQSAGACVNTTLFCVFMASWQVLMVDGGAAATHATLHAALAAAVARYLRADFVRLLMAGWRFWPLVSLGNFALVPDLATRNLVGGLAGIVWGVYVNLLAAGSGAAGSGAAAKGA